MWMNLHSQHLLLVKDMVTEGNEWTDPSNYNSCIKKRAINPYSPNLCLLQSKKITTSRLHCSCRRRKKTVTAVNKSHDGARKSFRANFSRSKNERRPHLQLYRRAEVLNSSSSNHNNKETVVDVLVVIRIRRLQHTNRLPLGDRIIRLVIIPQARMRRYRITLARRRRWEEGRDRTRR